MAYIVTMLITWAFSSFVIMPLIDAAKTVNRANRPRRDYDWMDEL